MDTGYVFVGSATVDPARRQYPFIGELDGKVYMVDPRYAQTAIVGGVDRHLTTITCVISDTLQNAMFDDHCRLVLFDFTGATCRYDWRECRFDWSRTAYKSFGCFGVWTHLPDLVIYEYRVWRDLDPLPAEPEERRRCIQEINMALSFRRMHKCPEPPDWVYFREEDQKRDAMLAERWCDMFTDWSRDPNFRLK